MPDKSKVFSVRLPHEDAEWVEAEAKKHGLSVTDFLKRAVAQSRERAEGRAQVTVTVEPGHKETVDKLRTLLKDHDNELVRRTKKS